jgi:hypothetical protein
MTMRQHRASVLGIGLLVSVSLAGCVGDATKSASDTPASTPIASVGSDTGPPVVEGPPSSPPEAGEVQARGVGIADWQISNLYIGDFASWATQPDVRPLTGDFNKDGRTDVALLRRTPGWGSMPVALSNGDGTWRIINTYIGGDFTGWATTYGVHVLTGDFNGDGRMDVALINQVAGWNTMPVAFANGDGTWRITNSSIGEDFPGWAATPGVEVLTGNFNDDKNMDVALLNRRAGWKTMPVAFANGDGTWRITNGSSGAFAGWATTPSAQLLTGDFNGDKRTDVALVNREAGWKTMPVAFANGDGTWRIFIGDIGDFAGWAATPGVEVLTGNFNDDKNMDVALLNRKAGWKTMPVAFANGDGSWRITNISSGAFAGWAATPGAQLLTGDFNGDKRTDVALVNRRAGWKTMPVAFANGDGTWRILDSSSGDFAGWAAQAGDTYLLTGDFDGDKRTDVLLLRQSPGWGSMPVAFWHDVLLPQTTIPMSAATGLGYILPRGVEGEPATSAPTEQNNTTSAPK